MRIRSAASTTACRGSDYEGQATAPCTGKTTCGNGVVEASEQCDDGDRTYVYGELRREDCRRTQCGQPITQSCPL